MVSKIPKGQLLLSAEDVNDLLKSAMDIMTASHQLEEFANRKDELGMGLAVQSLHSSGEIFARVIKQIRNKSHGR